MSLLSSYFECFCLFLCNMTAQLVTMLKKYDEQLLNALRQDARVSISKLARELNLSRTTVQSRISRLEQSGVIKRYLVELGEDFNASLVYAHVSIKCKQKLTGLTVAALSVIGEVFELLAISGEYDLLAVVKAESLAKLNQVIDVIGELDGVERTNTAIVLETKFKR